MPIAHEKVGGESQLLVLGERLAAERVGECTLKWRAIVADDVPGLAHQVQMINAQLRWTGGGRPLDAHVARGIRAVLTGDEPGGVTLISRATAVAAADVPQREGMYFLPHRCTNDRHGQAGRSGAEPSQTAHRSRWKLNPTGQLVCQGSTDTVAGGPQPASSRASPKLCRVLLLRSSLRALPTARSRATGNSTTPAAARTATPAYQAKWGPEGNETLPTTGRLKETAFCRVAVSAAEEETPGSDREPDAARVADARAMATSLKRFLATRCKR
jgi:hypothetical protein